MSAADLSVADLFVVDLSGELVCGGSGLCGSVVDLVFVDLWQIWSLRICGRAVCGGSVWRSCLLWVI
jgi:hypothetical protein